MADKLTIHIDVQGSNQTVSKFVAPEKGKLTILNNADAQAEVKFEGASPVCSGNEPLPILIIESNTQKDFKICKDTAGQSYKYTATVTGAEPEDPILIIERVAPGGGSQTNPIFFPEFWIGVVAGAIVTFGVTWLMRNKPTTRAQG